MIDDDVFKDVREVEREARQHHETLVRSLTHAIRMGQTIINLEGNTAFREYERVLSDMLAHRTEELLLAKGEVEVFKLQGRCLELRAILALVRDARNNLLTLANRLEQEEDRFAEVSRNFKPSKEQA